VQEDGHKETWMKNTRYVKKAASGRGWDVVREGHRRATAHGATKADAVETARELIRQEGGGEIRILNRTGKVVDASKVSRPRRRVAA
jgi:putative intracellular protease/amidase